MYVQCSWYDKYNYFFCNIETTTKVHIHVIQFMKSTNRITRYSRFCISSVCIIWSVLLRKHKHNIEILMAEYSNRVITVLHASTHILIGFNQTNWHLERWYFRLVEFAVLQRRPCLDIVITVQIPPTYRFTVKYLH